MIRCLISGKLHDAPQSRESAKGTSYTVAKLKCDDKSGAWIWASIIAFGEQAERLLSLKAGDTVSISGPAELSTWLDKEGNPKPSLSMTAEQLTTLRPKPRPPQQRQVAAAGFDDLDRWQP